MGVSTGPLPSPCILGIGVSLLGLADYYYFSYHPVDTRLGTRSSKTLGVAFRRINRLRDPVDLQLWCNILIHLMAFRGRIHTFTGFQAWEFYSRASTVFTFACPLCPRWLLGGQHQPSWAWFCICIHLYLQYKPWAFLDLNILLCILNLCNVVVILSIYACGSQRLALMY